MRFYTSGQWGFHVAWGWTASVFPRASMMALPNCFLTFIFARFVFAEERKPTPDDTALAKDAWMLLAAFSGAMTVVLGMRSNVAYTRWWEGGTLLQQTRGEWFNAYSSLVAFCDPSPEKYSDVEKYQHQLARFMSLLFCSALQQVSPDRNSSFEVLSPEGLDPIHLQFLNKSSDKVEVVLQWIQRSIILQAKAGVVTAPPPILSRAFQELARGVVNFQNARKIAEFPFPFPYAQMSIVSLLIHWCAVPFLCAFVAPDTGTATICSFFIIFFLWCLNFIAVDLEMPFGRRANDLPMTRFMQDFNRSLSTLLLSRANTPPQFAFVAEVHRKQVICRSCEVDGGVCSTGDLRKALTSLDLDSSVFSEREMSDLADGKRRASQRGPPAGQVTAETLSRASLQRQTSTGASAPILLMESLPEDALSREGVGSMAGERMRPGEPSAMRPETDGREDEPGEPLQFSKSLSQGAKRKQAKTRDAGGAAPNSRAATSSPGAGGAVPRSSADAASAPRNGDDPALATQGEKDECNFI